MMLPLPAAAQRHVVTLERPDDFDAWRERARALVAAGVAPADVSWIVQGAGERGLFDDQATADLHPAVGGKAVRASKAFLELARKVVLHRDPDRFAMLYRLLWKLQDNPQLVENKSDRDVHAVLRLAGQVRRDIHKMRAFVRFRVVAEADGVDRYVAWFEPDHHIVRANASFFLNRFASQRWSILTPELCLHWDGEDLTEAAGASKQDAPGEDAAEDLWQRYYAAIFNPARLKVSMMVKEMPRRYWKNLPEAQLIPQLIAGAQAREAAMVDQGSDPFPASMPSSLDEIASGIAACRRCAIGCNGTRAVAGEGPARAKLLIVGEQPGDHEEQQGRPFVGPAGQLLNEHLELTGFDRASARLTNAVKHFKFEERGTRRIHQSPTAGEIDRCRWWLEAERRIVQPHLIVALGASAGRALLGRTPRVGQERGKLIQLPDGARMLLTVHPSYLLRLDGEAQVREQAAFTADLRVAKALLEGTAAVG